MLKNGCVYVKYISTALIFNKLTKEWNFTSNELEL